MNNGVFLKLILFFFLLGALIWGGILLGRSEVTAPTVTNFEECAEAGYAVMESYPRQCRTADGQVFLEDIGNVLEKEHLIRVEFPRPNETIRSPLAIQGQARGVWFFEADFPVRLEDTEGNTIATGIAMTPFDWMTENFVPFSVHLEFETPGTERGVLILSKDNPSGLSEHDDEVRIPVRFAQEPVADPMTVLVHFTRGEDMQFDCARTVAAERVIPRTQQVARAALEELLKGTTQTEQEQGFHTSLNPGIRIQQLTIENGVARVDFNEYLDLQVGGSCRVVAIHAQIANTLLQFESVEEVVISMNGRTEDILQP
ncbi:MAG: GerMN domain-containing protein [Candidatus Yanofskybacteria bacterium]|nr:GerMN domain-containing protein [Candidatus Yanofskybacteria bacterium]